VTAVLGFALLVRAATGKTLQLSSIDALIVAFILWGVAVAAIYPETLDVRGLVKLITPFLVYTIAKNIIRNRPQYLRMLELMILGFVLPVTLSVVMIVLGTGVDEYGASYWTGIVRWSGAYASSHNMGHNMTFLLMLMGVYFGVRIQFSTERRFAITKPVILGVSGLAFAALYLLWMSQVRTALVGFVAFAAVYLAYMNRRLLIVLAGVAGVMVVLLFPILKPILLPDLVMAEKTGQGIEALGSGRLGVWAHNVELFAGLPLDRQLAGVGIGFNRLPGFVDSHNDLLDVLIQTGVVGAVLFIILQVAIFRRIGSLPTIERRMFQAIFLAVLVMNFASNSYISRFGLAQMYYLVMAYIELHRRQKEFI